VVAVVVVVVVAMAAPRRKLGRLVQRGSRAGDRRRL
jgi:hypothetical protein